MSSASTAQSMKAEPEPQEGQGGANATPPDNIIDLCRKTRQRAILALCREDDPARVAALVDHVIDVYEAAARMEPDFFTVADLQTRWKMARKTVERAGVPRLKMGGVIRYARTDVLAFEQSTREETD